MKFTESTVIENFIVEAKALGILLVPTDVERIVEAFIAGATDFMSMVKTKDEGTALTVDNVKGDMILAAVVEYNENEDGEGQSNWNYYFTFDAKDIEGKKRYQISLPQVHTVIAKRAYEMCRMKYSQDRFIDEYAIIFGNLIREILGANAKAGEEFTIEHEGYFLASSTVEDGIIERSLLPHGAMKKLIKDDATNEAVM